MIQEKKPLAEKAPEKLKKEAEEARNRASVSLDTLSHELQFSNLANRLIDDMADSAVGNFLSTTNKLTGQINSQLKTNPWPSLLLGAGLIYWLGRKRRPRKTFPPNDNI